MRGLAPALAALLATLLASAPWAQDTPPNVPAGTATIRGQLEHTSRPEGAAGVEVVLYALSGDGQAGLRRTTSDDAGAFVFEAVSNDPSTVYLIGARAGDVPFGTRLAFGPGELERTVRLTLSDATRETSVVEAGEVTIRLDPGCTHLRVRHTHALENPTTEVVHVPLDAREELEPLLEVVLPAGADGFEAPLGGEGLEFSGGRVRFWGPLYPGDQEISFAYGMTVAADAAPRVTLPGGARGVRLAAPRGTTTDAPLTPAGEVTLDESVYTSWDAGPAAKGTSLALAFTLPGAETVRGLRVPSARIWLEADDAAVDVSEEHRITVPAEVATTVRSEAPLLCLPLPAAAENLRFSSSALQLGLSRDPSGALALHGPLPAGEAVLGLRYRLPVTSDVLTFARRFPLPVDLLAVLIADTGLLPDTERLHRRRPIRSEDRNYMHLEAFSVEAGETVTLRLAQLEARGRVTGLASAGMVLLVALGALGFLASPLRHAREAIEEPDELSPEVAERESVYRAIDDLEDDFETGKISVEDHDRLRAELRARAVALLSAERARAAAPPPSPAAPATPFCSSCGTASREGDLFCARCGSRLDGKAPEPG